MALAVLGVGAVSALGQGAGTLEDGLAGRRLPAAEHETIATVSGEATLAVFRARSDGLERYVQARALRRLDRLSRMALLASHLALEDAGVHIADRSRLGLAFGSAFGPQSASDAFNDSLIEGGDRCASPTAFAGSVHNALGSQASIALGIEGPCQTVTALGQTLGGVLAWAEAWLARGEVDYVLAGAGEEVTPFAAFCAASAGGRAVLSEGFTAFLLGAGAQAQRRARVERTLSGHLTAHDARRLDFLPDLETLILSHDGGLGAEAAARLARSPVPACTPLPDCLPPCAGFDLALAALWSRAAGQTACLSFDRAARYTLVVLAR
ncbi:MAG: beta-ketoacyl synthase chain length factor [Planctomycetes bacterium]|nr:beta-ketoacyl synthase chain length factor [Planctomycetota bacterium]